MTKLLVKSWNEVPENFTGTIILEVPANEIFESKTAYYTLKDGKFHREDGPAMELEIGLYWFLNGTEITEEQHKLIMMFSKDSRKKLYENNNRGLKNLLGI